MLSKFAARRRGFTLIELLIVIVVIAILALIVIPRVMNASGRARDAARDANMQQIRNAIEIFRTDLGVYPEVLTDLTVPKDNFTGLHATTRSNGAIEAGFNGPYLTINEGGIENLPPNPYMPASVTTIAGHWDYSTSDNGANYSLDPAAIP